MTVRAAASGLTILAKRNGIISGFKLRESTSIHSWPLRSRAFGQSTDKDIEEFNQELEAVFGAPLSSDFQPKKNSTYQADTKSAPAKSAEWSLDHSSLTHVDDSGKASMVNVSSKADTKRVAVASGKVLLGPQVFQLVAANKMAKGDVLTVAKIAGIQAAKQTSSLIPLCHTIMLSGVNVNMVLDERSSSVAITAEVSSVGPTGVEMEALTAASVACLTVYDMCKAASKSIRICDIQLESKSGGKSGDWQKVETS